MIEDWHESRDVVLVAPEWPPKVGGIGRYLSVLAPALARAGVRVRVVGFRLVVPFESVVEYPWGTLVSLDYALPALWRWQTRIDAEGVLRAALAVRQWLRRNTGPNTIVEYPNWPGHGAFAPRRGKLVVRLSSPTVAITGTARSLQGWLEWLSVRRADGVIAHSRDIAARGRLAYGRRSTAVVPLGVQDYDVVRGAPDGYVHVGVFGRAELRKGTDLLLDAMSGSASSLPSLVLHFIGSNLDEFAALARVVPLLKAVRSEWRERIVEHGVLCDELMQERWSKTDWLLVPSRSESFSLVGVEAMRAGVPICMANTGAAQEFTEHGAFVRLFEPGDANAIRRALEGLQHVSALEREELGRLARASYERHYTDTQFARRTMRAWSQLT